MVDDFKYLKGTVHHNKVNGLVYETALVVQLTYPRLGTSIVAYRGLLYTNSACGPEGKIKFKYATSKR